jgi:hypothetical protein
LTNDQNLSTQIEENKREKNNVEGVVVASCWIWTRGLIRVSIDIEHPSNNVDKLMAELHQKKIKLVY